MVEPVKIIDEGEDSVSIEWSDGIESNFAARRLRVACPCAGCINEWTGEKMLKDDSVPDDVKISHISVVGRYALNFHFSDGHETGIFSFRYLREIDGN
ncbi:MAG: DUF971 domain-containing protein [Acidobacteria bacterium]|nr:MAG: DUF971 domain-containing protein [Acidobacteriota bacterium]REK01873.1 MAG: DUF971 domain-containing protein [Acidobacteriota bacterium]REK14829.1 MAG: DUF971 domain-containing protein [Acidobacteriota bacterium]REK45544.1 MAG: DUF971 domain-containing protein [Acidobacteriota bacterium]